MVALQNFKELWKSEKLFRLYVMLLLLAFVKQLIDFQALVDTAEYQNAAINFLKNFNLDSCTVANCDHVLHETRRTIGYPLLLVITGSFFPLSLFIQVVLAVFVPVLGKKLVPYLGLPASITKAFLLLLLLYPLQFYYAVLPMPEVWCQFLVLLGTLFYLQKKWWQTGVVLVFLLLLKPVFLMAAFLVLVPFFKDPFKRWGLLLPWIPFLFISAWNSNTTGKFHYTSMGVENAWEFNQRAVLNKVMTETERDNYYEKHDSIFASLTFTEKYVLMQNEVRKNIVQHWKLYALLHIQGSIAACLDPGRYDLIAFFEISEGKGFMTAKTGGNWMEKLKAQPTGILVYLFFFFVVNAIKFTLALFAMWRKPRIWFPIFTVLAIFVAVTGPVGSARYLYPFMPLVCMMAAHGWFLWQSRNEKNIIA